MKRPTLDKFGIEMLQPSVGKEWFNSWSDGPPRTYSENGGDADPELALANGHHVVSIGGARGLRPGQMRVVGAHPRVYVRASESFEIPPPIRRADMWNNVELTFYAYCTGASDVPWAGLAAAVKTNHWPDSWQCTSGGYVARMLFDGRVDFVKELYHDPNTTFVAGAVPNSWGADHGSTDGTLPLNRWIGFKLLARNVEWSDGRGPHVRLELFRDLSVGGDECPAPPVGGGAWERIAEFTDDGSWSSGMPCTGISAPDDEQYGDAGRPFTWPNYSVYLRTDGLTDDIPQYYTWFSVREVSSLRY